MHLVLQLAVRVTIPKTNFISSGLQRLFRFDVAIDALLPVVVFVVVVVVSTNERLAGFPGRVIARAMISGRFGGNELLLSAVRRVGNAANAPPRRERDFKFGRCWATEIPLAIDRGGELASGGQRGSEIRRCLPPSSPSSLPHSHARARAHLPLGPATIDLEAYRGSFSRARVSE